MKTAVEAGNVGPKANSTGGKREMKRQKSGRHDEDAKRLAAAEKAAEKLEEEARFLRQQSEDLAGSHEDIGRIFSALRQAESEYEAAEGGGGAAAEGDAKGTLVSELKRIFIELGISQQRYWNGTLVGNDLRTYFKHYVHILEKIGE